MTYSFVDCQGFAGGMAVGATLAGFRLVGKLEQVGGFGVPAFEANRRFLGDAWEAQVSEPAAWRRVPADVVVGTPPCAAFSGMSVGTSQHGIDSSINDCMRALFHYAARVRPQAVVMESVGQAFTKGLPLMRELSQELNQVTHGGYHHVTHVLQNNLTLGGCTRRRRYFLVVSSVPFGVEPPSYRPATVADALDDLADLPLSWDDQDYRSSPTWWSVKLRRLDGRVDGHVPPESPFSRRIHDLVDPPNGVPWHPRESESDVLRRYHETHGELPASWQYATVKSKFGLAHLTRDKQLIERDFNAGGFSKPKRWPWDDAGRVLNGAGPFQVWHPNGRFITHREAARIMGFPDAWRVGELRSVKNLHSFWGKGTSVHPARWVMSWLRRSLDGNPGGDRGVELENGDRFIDVSALPRLDHAVA